jgi:hypothetical protein
LVAWLLLLRQLSGFESRHLSKIQSGRYKQRIRKHTLARQKTYKNNEKNVLYLEYFLMYTSLKHSLNKLMGLEPISVTELQQEIYLNHENSPFPLLFPPPAEKTSVDYPFPLLFPPPAARTSVDYPILIFSGVPSAIFQCQPLP